MVLSREITERIKEVLEKHPEGLSITDLVKSVEINRNTAGRYLENLLLSGQVEMRRFGMAKMYTLTKRLPVSSVLSISSELVMQLNFSQRVTYVNDPLLIFLGAPAKDLFGKNIEFTPFSIVFEDVFPELLDRFRRGLNGEEWHGELSRPVQETFFFCRVTPTVSSEGAKGVSVLLENISDQKRDEVRIRESEERLRSIFKVSPVGIGVMVNRIFLEVNDRFCQMTGYSPAGLVGKSARMLYTSEEAFENTGMLYTSQIRQSGTSSIETQWVKKDGTVIDILLNLTPLDPATISGGITFTALDITTRKQAEQALRESESTARALLNAPTDTIILLDNRGVILDLNETAVLKLARKREDVIGILSDTVLPSDLAQERRRKISEVLTTKKPVRFTDEHLGTWFDNVAYPILDTRGNVGRLAIFARDITDLKRAEAALRESEDRYRKLVEISPDAVILHRDGKIIYVNPAAVRLVGASHSDELIGRGILDVVAPEYRDSVHISITQDLAGKTTPPMELQILRIDKKRVMVEGRGVSTFIDGRPAVLVAINDITERYRAGLALKESEERYRAIFENTGAATAILEENTLVSLMNSEFERFSGYTKKEVEKKRSWTDFVVKQDLERMLAWHHQRRKSGDAPHQYEAGVVKKNGEIRRALITVGLIPGTTQTLVSLTDITDRKLADEQLLQRGQQYHFIADNSLDIINRQTPDCICTYVSPAITPLLGYSEVEVLGRPVLAMVHPDDVDLIRRNMIAIVENGSSHLTSTFRFRHKDGRYLWFESTTRVIRDEKTGQIREFLSISRDITARKGAEDALRASEERYRCLLEQTFDAVAIHKNKKIAFLNERAAQILGAATPDDLTGRSIFDLIDPDSCRDLEERIRMMASDPAKPVPVLREKFIRVDGTTVTVDVMAVRITDTGDPAIQVMFREIASPEPK